MAIYHLHIKSISRGAGRSATGAAAYRAGEKIRDERTGVLHNHSGRRDVSYKEIVLPQRLAGVDLTWATDRTTLWNAVERAEKQRNSRVAREYEVALPPELTATHRVELARSFSRYLANRHDAVIDLTVHEPRPAGDPRNYHAHLLATTREVSGAGLGAKTGLDMQSAARLQRGLPPAIVEFNAIRERWAALTNEALAEAGYSARIDHRSYQARGINREPQPYIPYAAIQTERHGHRSEIAEYLRDRYRRRVKERAALDERRQQEAPVQMAKEGRAPTELSAVQRLELLRGEAREAWLELRREAQSALSTPMVAREPPFSPALALSNAPPRELGARARNSRSTDVVPERDPSDNDVAL